MNKRISLRDWLEGMSPEQRDLYAKQLPAERAEIAAWLTGPEPMHDELKIHHVEFLCGCIVSPSSIRRGPDAGRVERSTEFCVLGHESCRACF